MTKMKKQFLLLVLGVFMINFVLGIPVCIDKEAPTWPEDSSLDLSVVNDDEVKLVWNEAEDKPECSNISHYYIFKNNSYLISVNSTSYIDNNLEEGDYEYVVYPVDLGGNEGNGISELISLEEEDDSGGTSSSGEGSSTIPLWECGEWSECEDGTKERTCVDLRDYFSDRTETKNCTIDSELGSNSYEDKGMSNVEDLDSSSNVGSNTGDSKGFFQRITGEVIGEGDEKNRNLGFLGVFLVIIILFLVLMRKKQRK